jgi:hypothetical protein
VHVFNPVQLLFDGLSQHRIVDDAPEVGRVYSVTEVGTMLPDGPPPPAQPPTVFETQYSYQYDAYGNWTELTTASRSDPGAPLAFGSVRRRKLTYYWPKLSGRAKPAARRRWSPAFQRKLPCEVHPLAPRLLDGFDEFSLGGIDPDFVVGEIGEVDAIPGAIDRDSVGREGEL